MISKKINDDFEELQVIVNAFETCREVDEFDRTFAFDEWKERADVESIKAMLNDLQKFDYNVTRSIKPQESRGMI